LSYQLEGFLHCECVLCGGRVCAVVPKGGRVCTASACCVEDGKNKKYENLVVVL